MSQLLSFCHTNSHYCDTRDHLWGVSMSSEWMADGKCREYPAGTFFPRDGVGVIIAQRICATCPVASECLEYALESHVDHGIWGGCSERERRRILRERRRRRIFNTDAS